MKRMIQGLFVASFLIVLQAVPANATIERIFGDVCGNGNNAAAPCFPNVAYPVRQGQTTTVTVEGDWVDTSTALEVTGSGVTVSSAPGSTSRNKKIQIVVASNAQPGLRTIKLRYLVEFSGPDTFNILVVRNGTVTGVDVPSPAQFFNSVDITLTGQNIGNAGVITSGFNPQPTAQVLENNTTQAVVRLQFSGSPLAEASGTIFLFDKSCGLCSESFNLAFSKLRYGGINGSGQNNVSILGPNAVSSITFPDGGNVQVGSVLSIKIKLVRPARSGTSSAITFGAIDRRRGGETVHWQLVPSTVFEAAPGSGIAFSPTGLNQVRIPTGDEFKIITVRLAQVPSNCPRQGGCQGRIQTRMTNLNTDQPPFFKEAIFTMFPASAAPPQP